MKLFLAVLLIISAPCFSQNTDKNTTLINKYDKWLKTVQLDQLFEASEIRLIKNEPSPNNSESQNNEKIIETLVLKPTKAYNNPVALVQAWSYIKNGFAERGINIYQLLFNKLADYTALPLNTIVIEMKTKNPDIFSFNIQFDKKLIVGEETVLIKGGDVSVDYNFDTALKSIIRNSYRPNSTIPGLKAYYRKLDAFFRNYNHKKGYSINIDTLIYSDATIQIEVSNIYAQIITGERFSEIFRITISLTHPDEHEPGLAEISYLGDVFYAAGILDHGDYRDASFDFSPQLSNFNLELDKEFRKIFYNGK